MTRYSASTELSNLKKSLKSGGSWIVATHDLAEQLECSHPLLGGLGPPVFAFCSVVRQACDLEVGPVQTGFVNNAHIFIVPLLLKPFAT